MIADLNTMSRMFKECNEKYFDGSLPTPYFCLMNKLNTLARFEYNKDKKGKHPIKWQALNIAWNGIKDNKDHGREFMRIANEINEKYGLNVTKTKDASSFKRTEKAPNFTGLFQFLWG